MNVPTTLNSAEGGDEDVTSIRLSYPWLADLESTLSSMQGSKAFESYLAQCGSLSLLEFIWACDGMKTLVNENPETCGKLVSCIYKNYIISGALTILSNRVVIEIAKSLEAYFERPEPSFSYPAHNQIFSGHEERQLNVGIFDDARNEVEMHLKNTIFPQFQNAVKTGNVCVGDYEDENINMYGAAAKHSSPYTSKVSRSKLASHPEAFARALCEKLEGLKIDKK